MKYILLCGGIGKRCNNYSLPKPLNFINGKHMIERIIQNIPSEEIYIIYNVFLEEYNFEEIVKNLFKEKQIHFSKVDYLTRGAVETAYIGMNQFTVDDSPIVFMDNDNIHSFTDFQTNNFIGYGINYDKTNYSFIEIKDGLVVNIEEKNKISDNYCCGIYGFKNTQTFQKYAKQLIEKNYKTKNEFYFSQLYKLLLKEESVVPIYMEETNHIGSYDEIMTTFGITDYRCEKLRFCFDLDNTLVTFPTIPNDYSSVKPIPKMIALANQLKKAGHEIVIHTARRMKTHGHNLGKVVRDIANVTINTLEDFGIPYDELVFGKPHADIYIDDRAINPYCNDISYFGLFNEKNDFLHNRVENNYFNQIKKRDNVIRKNGPVELLRGELFFYQNMPSNVTEYFPKLYGSETQKEIEIQMEHINGIPLYFLYKNRLVTKKHIDDLFYFLNKLHSHESGFVSEEKIRNNYFKKLQKRYDTGYAFENAKEVYDKIVSELESSYSPERVGVIHGDFWFSNILLDYNDNFKFIDMRGQVDEELTLSGDKYYDYGKFYQSILGYDLVLNGTYKKDEYYHELHNYFLEKCQEKNLNVPYLKAVTNALIFGTIPFVKPEQKERVWNMIYESVLSPL